MFERNFWLFNQHQLWHANHIEYGTVTRFQIKGNSQIGDVVAIATVWCTTETEYDLWSHPFGKTDG